MDIFFFKKIAMRFCLLLVLNIFLFFQISSKESQSKPNLYANVKENDISLPLKYDENEDGKNILNLKISDINNKNIINQINKGYKREFATNSKNMSENYKSFSSSSNNEERYSSLSFWAALLGSMVGFAGIITIFGSICICVKSESDRNTLPPGELWTIFKAVYFCKRKY